LQTARLKTAEADVLVPIAHKTSTRLLLK